MKDKDVGTGTGTTYEGFKVYFAHARSAVSGWGVDVGPERGELEAQLKAIWTVGAALAAIGLTIGVLVALMLASRLRRSITVLADSARNNAPPRLAGLRTREISQLKEALDTAAAVRQAQAQERESRLVAEAREAEAKEASRMKDRFIALLSHELRNPLAPIRNAVYLLRRLPDQAAASLAPIVDMLDRQSEHLTRLVNDLLDVSRISVDKMSLHTERIDLRAVVEQAIETAIPGIEARRHRLTRAIPDHEVPVIGDSQRLSQILSNLLDNAAKFTAEGGHIYVAVREHQGSAFVAVRDNGRGIDPVLLQEVFLPFVQSEKQTTHVGPAGLGLGLSLAQSLAELHGGSLRAHSEGMNRGSEFVLRLPLAATPTPQGRASSAPAPLEPIHRRVLVVDDNVDGAVSTAELLEGIGCVTNVVHDGPTALRAAADWQPDAVLLDIGMPGMTGYEVARQIRESRVGKRPLIVALTGWGQEVDKERTRAAGFDLHLVKPIEADQLRSALRVRPTDLKP
jgi:signal transduction histidine kinase/CheY-like chemotaxis protein